MASGVGAEEDKDKDQDKGKKGNMTALTSIKASAISMPHFKCNVRALLYSTARLHRSTPLCCTVLYCTVLYSTVLYCTVLYCTVLYCTVLHCTVLYCTENLL